MVIIFEDYIGLALFFLLSFKLLLRFWFYVYLSVCWESISVSPSWSGTCGLKFIKIHLPLPSEHWV